MPQKLHLKFEWLGKLFTAVVAELQAVLAHARVLLGITAGCGFTINGFPAIGTELNRRIAAAVIHIRATDFVHFATRARFTATIRRWPSTV
jgi:hypothetical protein